MFLFLYGIFLPGLQIRILYVTWKIYDDGFPQVRKNWFTSFKENILSNIFFSINSGKAEQWSIFSQSNFLNSHFNTLQEVLCVFTNRCIFS